MLEKTGEREVPANPGSLQGIEHSHIIRYVFGLSYVENKDVLDCACGIGYGTRLLSEKATFVQGWDYDLESVELAKKFYKNTNCDFKQVNVEQQIPKDKTFDTIVSFETIEHLEIGKWSIFFRTRSEYFKTQWNVGNFDPLY
jgi:2-polyprenyl-3-methyl-5-hydroxy-6-metoxy-1,4-benzoquinol methylase